MSDPISTAEQETEAAVADWIAAGHQMISDAMARARASVPPQFAPLAAATEAALRQIFAHMVQGPHAWAAERDAHSATVAASTTPAPAPAPAALAPAEPPATTPAA